MLVAAFCFPPLASADFSSLLPLPFVEDVSPLLANLPLVFLLPAIEMIVIR